MGCEEAPHVGADAVGRQVADAVENLVTIWFAAVEDVTPRLPARQVRALRIVRRRPELNLTALAEHLDIGLPTASRLCDRLEAAGLLQRNVQPDDRREVRLVVTAHGRRFLTDVTDRLSVYLTTALDGLSPGQRRSLEEILRAFHDSRTPLPDTRPTGETHPGRS
ncbi:MarR family winged helix-turn-helix transcriptional regulator [Streptomyces phyllanthi]|uniref:Winged helix-turn-helix transcriptional regulator n=1 Tax=Streptomyces phyllanthi TaxID=1803180 RepID=A0A5N8W573_9ACTN|nr:MarR family winged helix-turn-helix transcriptional regulator [Streptomyces phyllanthi]MPY41285.1 winged helix-turn-helix transcriptional regulator [Streptomyces phyllanthi]